MEEILEEIMRMIKVYIREYRKRIMHLGEWDDNENDRQYEEKDNGWDRISVNGEKNTDTERNIYLYT